jgi:uncharacterized protein (DUF1330 family)
MTIRVVGLIKLQDMAAFDVYRAQVGATIERFGGTICRRGEPFAMPWNELNCDSFDAYVELEFPDEAAALAWSGSAEYLALVPVRSKAMKLTLFAVK